jgi:hypothetical protein
VLDGQAVVLVGVGFYSLSHHNRVPIPSTTPAVITTGSCCWRAGARPEETTGWLAPAAAIELWPIKWRPGVVFLVARVAEAFLSAIGGAKTFGSAIAQKACLNLHPLT